MTVTLASYDALPYPGEPVAAMHPDRLAVLGRLHGLATASAARCRVLELGCCDGGNLVPLALAYPESRFVGLDLSVRQVEAGRAEVAALGLPNLELRHASILDVDPGWGAFDYVLCHGVYSWVPADVRRKILAVARENLAPAGVAYVAYNTYPGWHVGVTVREWLRRAGGDLARARAALDSLRKSMADDASPHGRQLHARAEELANRPDYYLAHEYLAEENEPVWFHEFVARADAAGLRFLSEAHPATSEVALLPEPSRRALADNLLCREQTLDILRNRTFRQSLLCHAEAAVREEPDPAALAGMSVASDARRIESSRPGVTAFALPGGAGLTTTDAGLIALFAALEEAAPAAVPIAALPVALARVLGCMTRGLVEVYRDPVRFAATPGEFPRVSPWARRQAVCGPRVTDLRHRLTKLDEVERVLVPLLDGQTPRSALVARLEEEIATGRLVVTDGEPPVGEALRGALAGVVEVVLRNLARQALFTSDPT